MTALTIDLTDNALVRSRLRLTAPQVTDLVDALLDMLEADAASMRFDATVTS